MRISQLITFLLNTAMVIAGSLISWSGVWFYILMGLSFVNIPFLIWQISSKCPSIEITNDVIVVNGLKIDRKNVLEWRVFRTSSYGERGRYIELQLARIPNDTLRWKLAKLYEQVAPSMRFDRKMSLAREPKIITSLKSWDLKESEIDRALQNGESNGYELKLNDISC